MPAEVALVPIYATLKALLAADATLAGLLGTKPFEGGAAIFDEGAVPLNYLAQTPVPSYLTIGAGTQVPFHAMGPTFGWNCTLQIKAVGQISEAAGLVILSTVAAVVPHGRVLAVTGYRSATCDEFTVQPTIVTTAGAIVTREWPAILRVYVRD